MATMYNSDKYTNNIRIVTGTPVLFTDDSVLECDTTLGPVVINLLQIPANKWSTQWKLYVIDKSNNAGTNNITINAGAGQRINNSASITINTNNGYAMVRISGNLEFIATTSGCCGDGGGCYTEVLLGVGAYLWPVPAGVNQICVSMAGGGGGGGNSEVVGSGKALGGGGGAGGAFISKTVPVTPLEMLAILVGAGGGPASGGNSTAFSSTFISLLCNGGDGGGSASVNAANASGGGGLGGTALSSILPNGNTGGAGASGSIAAELGGAGGGNIFGQGGPSTPAESAGINGAGYGSGGSGAAHVSSNDSIGGNGADGFIMIRYVGPCVPIPQP
jgi:hypothetical protein